MFEWLFKAKQIKATKQIHLLFEPTHVLWDITGNLVLLAASNLILSLFGSYSMFGSFFWSYTEVKKTIPN